MNSELRRAIDQARQLRQEAELRAYETLKPYIDCDFQFSNWTGSIENMYKSQWCGEHRREGDGWDWVAIGRENRAPKDQILAVKVGDRLSILSYIKTSRERVRVEIVEADPRPDCPLKGKRLAIVLELAVLYGQRTGCKEIHIAPVNDELLALYRDIYGFEEVSNRMGLEYLKKDLI